MQNTTVHIPSLYSTWIEVDLDALVHNFKRLKEKVCSAEVIPVVKADAEGLGARNVALTLQKAGVKTFAVSHFTEALDLRKHGISADILVMNGLLPDQMSVAVDNGLQFFVFDEESLRNANRAAQTLGKKAIVHVKIEIGLGRLGILPAHAAALKKVADTMEWVSIVGVAAHLPSPDVPEHDDLSESERQEFLKAAAIFDPDHKGKWHLSASSATLRFPHMHLDAVRVGRLSWGVTQEDQPDWGLKPVGSYRTRLVQVKDLPKGHNVGYNMRFSAPRDIKLGVLPLGAVDGFLLPHRDTGYVLVGGKRCRLIGVCSCVSMVDVTDVDGVRAGDEVTIVGRQGDDYISISEFARFAGSSYGSVARKISYRIPRFYISQGKVVAGQLFGEKLDLG